MSQYRQYTDDLLVQLLAEGDTEAFSELYERYAGILYVHAHKRVADREIAQDLVQDLFASIWMNRNHRLIATSVSSYLYSALRYKIINWLLREKRLSDYEASLMDELSIEPTGADHGLRERELRQLIEREVARLPKKMRQIFQMSRDQQLCHREIAEQLNLSPGTVKKQINSALRVLRVKLEAFLAMLILFFL